MNEAFLLFSWFVYFCLHSILASIPVKAFFTSLFSIRSARIYRVAYNLFFGAGLVVLLYLQLTINSAIFYEPGVILETLAFFIMGVGASIMIMSIRNYDWKSFMGISPEKKHALVIEGMNRYIRHPLYSGTMLFSLGFLIWQPYCKNLLLWVLMWIYLAVGIIYEERKLVRLYGAEYQNYQKRVKKMIPFIW